MATMGRAWGVIAMLLVVTGTLGYLPPDQDLPQYPGAGECAATCASLESRQGEAADDAGGGGGDGSGSTEVAVVGCGAQCRVDHCSDGCTVWERALNSSCQEVCNGTSRQLTVKALYCTIGCQHAVNQYFRKLRADIGTPPTPSLVKDSLGATYLTLRWESENLKQFDDKILYFAQCKFEDTEGSWKYCDNQKWNGNNQIFVFNLQPFTKYRFRLAVLLSSTLEDDRPIFSEPSSVINTFASGPPTSAPVILKAMAIDHSRIYVNWKPGLFTNGPLFSYVLRLQQEGHEAFEIKDIPISQDTFIFQFLIPNTNYSVTLTMRNGDGEGPATSTFVKTLFEPDGNSSEAPIVVIASEYSIMKETNIPNSPSSLVKLYSSDSEIRDTAVLVPVSQLFLCDSKDRLYRVSLGAPNMSSLILEPNTTTLRPWAVSVDWLHGWLYVAGANDATGFWEIRRSNFDGRNLTELLPGLVYQPIKLEVDPINGYLFWLTLDGIYRVDLDAFENEESEPKPEHILKRNNLGSFIVDYENTRLLVSFQLENTIKSVSLDGKVIIDVRANTKQPRFKNVSSLSMTNGLFYWTDGEEVLAENYESNEQRYFYNILYSERSDNYFLNVHILTAETQPIPFPTLPPTDVQALALSDRVKISWRVPASRSSQGKGAWRNWSYALLIEDDINGELIQEREIRETVHFVDDLRDHSLYSIKVAAYSSAGDGPWSKKFKVQTLKKELKASVFWSTNNSLLQSDLIGCNTEILINVTHLDKQNPFFVSDVDWYKDTLFITGNNTKLYRYNTTSRRSTPVKHVGSVSSVAVEWLTEKIYWADPKKQIIFRSNFDGGHQEPIVFSKIVKNLLLDPLEAYLYWSTSRTVEVVRLNGDDRRKYRSEEDFNGQHVAGITLDQDNRFVYWVVGDNVGDFMLYRSLTAHMQPAGPDFAPEMVSAIPSIIGHSLSYISNRFLYLASPQEAITSDAYGNYVSSMTVENLNSELQTLFVKTADPPVDSKLSQLIVCPEPVDANSIAIKGTWRDFNVTWKPSNNTNHGRVFYEVVFDDHINFDTQPISTIRTTINYPNADTLLPYTLVSVSVRAYTYWDSAPTVNKVLRSPQSVPSEPTKPRLFVESYKDAMAENIDNFITFRWNMPEFENGPITGFRVQCWLTIGKIEVPLCDSVDIPVSELEYKVHNLQSNASYSFQVCAKTEVGVGPYTNPVSVTIENENPVPQLLVATMEDVKKVDLDQRTNVTITPHIAVEVAHIAAESKIYWINEMQELVTADVEGKNITKILTLNNTALSLSVDWISRNLYWTESSYEEYGISHIMKLDLSVWEAGQLKFSRILSRNRRIVNLDVAPLTGMLFWIELSEGDSLGYVIQSDLSGENVQPFFNHTEDCNCPFRPTIQPVFTVDNTEPQSPYIYWITDEGHLNIADIEGCICSHVLEAGSSHGLPPTSLTTDKTYVYWSDMDTHKIHYIDKNLFSSENVREYPINNVRNIIAIGKSLQPYPDSDCLMPQRAVYSVQKIAKTPTSITVRLPDPAAYVGCQKYNLPATLYTIDVTECKKSSTARNYDIEEDDTCESDEEKIRYETYFKEFEAKNLKPFTRYLFHLTLTNYYSDKESINIEQYGLGLILRTGAGIPTKPEDVRARPLTPFLAMVDWLPPMYWNAEYVRYKVFWRPAKPAEGVTGGEKMVRDGDDYTHLQPLIPGQEYIVIVRAYPENFTDVYSQSDDTTLYMHSEPNNLTLMSVTSDAMNISWVPMSQVITNHTLEYTRINADRWQVVSDFTKVDNKLIYKIKDLTSKEFYKFRLILKYLNHTENFIWPADDRFTFQTLEDIPTAPGTPSLINLQNSNYQLRWDPATSHSLQIIKYYLEGTVIDSSMSSKDYPNITSNWRAFYNGSENVWNLQPNMHEKYLFRVRARNDYGYGNWSEVSSIVDLTEMTRAMLMAQEHLGLILGLCVPVLAIILLCFCYVTCPLSKKPKEEQKKIPIKVKPKVELATLREIPRGNFVESNALYVAAVDSDSNESLLPKVQRDQISLAKFLGSGAFGEVFQGVARDLEGPGSKTPIAVKTLRKGASAQEKNEFIQEAKLMSHFQHKHVLRLLGVCLDTDPPLLLLELMAGGDLLSYLRTSRALKPTDSSALRLQDLLSMCEDVARGCRYLEELHFVHRDLACRNCLVSARERENRVVKIGDFGLARDIYKNDYYRKEGEGLLPVRWMAPESLVDGVFTSQSDVWAFGVLMWEITSLGQQPYQARTNLEVLHHVRAGGRLPKPLNCPPRLHQLMLRCWSAVDARPSFKVCLEHIVALRNCTEDATLSPVNPGQFLVQGNAYKSSHFKDNLSIQTLLQDSDSSKPTIGPKYSWLLDDVLGINESKDPRAAYEIPKSIPVVVEDLVPDESRYIEICGSEKGSKQDIEESSEIQDIVQTQEVNQDENSDCNRVSVTSLNLIDNKKFDKTPSLDKRSSSASLGDKFKAADGMKQSGSYARLVGNGESVSSLSDWRRVKKMTNDERERLSTEKSTGDDNKSGGGGSNLILYSMVSFPQTTQRHDNELVKSTLPKLQRSKSNLQTSKANIPLVINSGLLNMLRQAPETEDEDDVNYANIDPENMTVTDL